MTGWLRGMGLYQTPSRPVAPVKRAGPMSQARVDRSHGCSSAIGGLLGKLSLVSRVSKFSGRVIESAGTVRFDCP